MVVLVDSGLVEEMDNGVLTAIETSIRLHSQYCILNWKKEIIWSSNVLNIKANSSALLLDTGDLVLRDNSNGRIIWESFQSPTDSLVRRLSLSAGTNAQKIQLNSWRSNSDPSTGSFSADVDPLQIRQLFICRLGGNVVKSICIRKALLGCDRNSSAGKQDRYVKLMNAKVSDFAEYTLQKMNLVMSA
ncbi:hypothetical protein ACH5RR_018789 [Cinchona calisaya]|uniref:Bulb-type lectin domain-containing protein n=1 Tax=Cinchona calisaya TaxID=153742 RepID=A0ABD2ZMG5_9GENT